MGWARSTAPRTPTLARIVAVKLLSGRFADNAAIRGRFTREALAVARLSHAPSTVTIFDVGEHNGRPYIVMEYLPGGSLADRLQREGAQPIGRSLEWLGQAAAALDAAHANGIVHRDVKPANLLLDSDDRVKVADFGVASAADLGSFTEAGTVVGTAGYLAPEQARGERATPASDLYALAVVAFELLTGKRPFERESSTAEAIAHVSAAIPPASHSNPRLPPELDDVLARGLAKEPEHRFGSAAEFVGALREATRPGRRNDPRRRAPSGSDRHASAAACRCCSCSSAERCWRASSPRRSSPAATGTRPPGRRRRGPSRRRSRCRGRRWCKRSRPPPSRRRRRRNAGRAPTESPSELNDRGFELMQAGRYEEALPLLEQAVAGLSGSGETAEAYASYNLAFTRLALGQCEGVVELLDRSEQVQGKRKEISRLRKEAEKSCGGGDER